MNKYSNNKYSKLPIYLVIDSYGNTSNNSDISELSKELDIPTITRDELIDNEVGSSILITFGHEVMNPMISNSNYFINYFHSLMGPTKTNLHNENTTKDNSVFIYPTTYAKLLDNYTDLDRCLLLGKTSNNHYRVFTRDYPKILKLLTRTKLLESPIISTHYTTSDDELLALYYKSLNITNNEPTINLHPLHYLGTKYFTPTRNKSIYDNLESCISSEFNYNSPVLITDGITSTLMEYLYYHHIHNTSLVHILISKKTELKLDIQDENNLQLFKLLVKDQISIDDEFYHYVIYPNTLKLSISKELINRSLFISGMKYELKRVIELFNIE
jgi:hypothetical protein